MVQGRDGRVFVASGARSHITVFSNGRRIARAGGPGSGPNQFIRPHDIDVDDSGRLIVGDSGNNRLQGLPLDLEFEFSIGGAPPHDFNQLKYFALDELAGCMWATRTITGLWYSIKISRFWVR